MSTSNYSYHASSSMTNTCINTYIQVDTCTCRYIVHRHMYITYTCTYTYIHVHVHTIHTYTCTYHTYNSCRFLKHLVFYYFYSEAKGRSVFRMNIIR